MDTLLGIPEGFVTLEVRQDPFVRGGAVVAGAPFISVSLFDRGPEPEDRVARAVTRHFQAAGIPHLDVCLLRLNAPGAARTESPSRRPPTAERGLPQPPIGPLGPLCHRGGVSWRQP